MKIQRQISQKAYHADHSFMGSYQKLIKDTVIPYQYSVLKDEAEGAEKSHVIANFINAGKALRGEDAGDGYYGMVFQDSDLAKWIEAAAYSLTSFPDPELERTADEAIGLVAAAQDEDGYLNTYYTIKDRDKRYTNLLEGHELYCSGHMMEAACAYYEATGKDALLEVMEKNMEHIYDYFITQGHEGYPGHPEIELALMKLYRVTGNEHAKKLAEHFINVRGVDPHFYEKEAKKRDWTVWNANPSDYNYMQAGAPVRKQTRATGHAVRAVYLLTGMADAASEDEDASLLAACERLWDNITKKRIYVTGGIGSTFMGEAFSTDYDLPNDTAYCETCASIGLMFFASRMLENQVRGEYGDVMERAFYNTVLAGMSLDGKRFFYVNPLECAPGISGISPTHRHVLTTRPGWHTCACCPPNAARLISSIGKYAYGENESTAFCHLFAGGHVEFGNGLTLDCETEYPYGFQVKYTILKGNGGLALRIPGWSKTHSLLLNGATANASMKEGYAYIQVRTGDVIELLLDDQPYRIYASSRVPRLTGCTAIGRGPLIYCFEGVDNGGDVMGLSLKREGVLTVGPAAPGLPPSTGTLLAEALKAEAMNGLYSQKPPAQTPVTATAIPYYAWCNRGENQMRVWMPTA